MCSVIIYCGLALVFFLLTWAAVMSGKDPDGKEDIAEYWGALEKHNKEEE